MSIRVLIAGLPRLLAEVVSAGLAQSPNLSFVQIADEAVRPGSAELDAAIGTHEPEAAIIGVKATESAAIEQTQLRHLGLAIVALAPDGAKAWNLRLCAELRSIEPPSPSAIGRAIEEAVLENDARGGVFR